MNNYSYKSVGYQTRKHKQYLTQKIHSIANRMKFQGRTATAIILRNKEEILLIKRSTPPFIGYWALPGGRAEPNETIEQTALREVKEETGLDVSIIRKIGEYHEEGTQGGQEYDYFPACFLVKIEKGNIQKQESEIADIKFFNLKDIPEVLAFKHGEMVKDYLKTRK